MIFESILIFGMIAYVVSVSILSNKRTKKHFYNQVRYLIHESNKTKKQKL